MGSISLFSIYYRIGGFELSAHFEVALSYYREITYSIKWILFDFWLELCGIDFQIPVFFADLIILWLVLFYANMREIKFREEDLGTRMKKKRIRFKSNAWWRVFIKTPFVFFSSSKFVIVGIVEFFTGKTKRIKFLFTSLMLLLGPFFIFAILIYVNSVMI